MREILKILESDSRLSPEEIATMTGKTEDEVRRVIEECERKGIIRRYKTSIDWEKAGEQQVFAFIDVKVSPERGVGFDDIAERIYRYPEVHSVYLVSGTHDLRVVVSGTNMKEVAFFVAEKLAPAPGVRSTSTSFVLKSYKMEGILLGEGPDDHRLAVSP